MVNMEPERRLQELIENGVLTEAGKDALRLALAFEEAIEQHEGGIESGELPADDPVVSALPGDSSLLGTYAALDEYADIESYAVDERVQLLTAIARFRNDSPTDGAPKAFVSARGNHLPGLLSLYERAVVYLWREECDPCDAMRSVFDNVFSRVPRDIMPIGVYGPDSPVLLEERYDVVGAPTTLFVLDGRVDARLQGAHEQYKVEAEVQKLRELGDSPGPMPADGSAE